MFHSLKRCHLPGQRSQSECAKARRLGMLAGRGRIARSDLPAKKSVGLLPIMADLSMSRFQHRAAHEHNPALAERPRNDWSADAIVRVFLTIARTRPSAFQGGMGLQHQILKFDWAISRANCAKPRREQLLQEDHQITAARQVRELDLIYVDMPPASLLLIHDFDVRRLALELAHIPQGRLEPLLVLA